MKNTRDLDAALEELHAERRNFLRSRNWHESCDWPGSLWLWSRTLPDGRTIACPEQTALEIEAAFDVWDEDEGEEDEGEEELQANTVEEIAP